MSKAKRLSELFELSNKVDQYLILKKMVMLFIICQNVEATSKELDEAKKKIKDYEEGMFSLQKSIQDSKKEDNKKLINVLLLYKKKLEEEARKLNAGRMTALESTQKLEKENKMLNNKLKAKEDELVKLISTLL